MGRRRTTNADSGLPEGIRPGKTPGTFEVRVALPAARRPDGSRRHREMVRVVHGGIREAKKRRAEMVAAREQHGGKDGTLAAHLLWWLNHVEPDLSPTTMRNYRAYTDRYINPAIGHIELRKVTARQLDDFYSDLRARLAPSTIRQCHSIIRKALSQAVKHGDLPANPATNASPPKLEKKELEPPDIATYRAIYERANRQDPALGDFLRVAAGTGARRGEVCGLRWYDLDMHGLSLTIARSIIETRKNGKPFLDVKGTKTDRVRRIALDPIVTASLAAHLRAMGARAAASGAELSPDGYVFSDELDGSRPWRPGRITTAFYRIRKTLKLDVRLHDLRHMHASQLLAAGVDVRTVAGRLGHKDPNVTLNVYAHFMPAADRAAATVVGELLHGPAGLTGG